MSVYARKLKDGTTVYRYDFIIQNRRFLSPTTYATRASAKTAERLRRNQIAEGKENLRDDLTLDEAAGEYWEHVAKGHRDARNIERRIETVIRLIGGRRRLIDIRFATINDAIQKRKQERVVNPAALRGGHKSTKTVSAATVNRELVDCLKAIRNHAALVHELALPKIDWPKLRLKEPNDIVREYSDAELAAWASHLGRAEQIFLGVAALYGPRLGEMFFPPDAIKAPFTDEPFMELGRYKGRPGETRTSRKDGSLLMVPLLKEHGVLLGQLAQRAAQAGLEVIWFDEAEGGRLSEISYYGMQQRLRTAAKKAGIAPGRIIHGLRHHAGTQMLRRTGNLILAQKALGHKQVTTTQRYAHALASDLRAGFLAVSRPIPDARPESADLPFKKQSDS